jgi:hypothetical protein
MLKNDEDKLQVLLSPRKRIKTSRSIFIQDEAENDDDEDEVETDEAEEDDNDSEANEAQIVFKSLV